jgi:hypothetical protein
VPDTVTWLKGGDLARASRRLERCVSLEDSDAVLAATAAACTQFIGQTLGALAALCALRENAALAPRWGELETAVDTATQQYSAAQVGCRRSQAMSLLLLLVFLLYCSVWGCACVYAHR